jgi:hypothetical protein
MNARRRWFSPEAPQIPSAWVCRQNESQGSAPAGGGAAGRSVKGPLGTAAPFHPCLSRAAPHPDGVNWSLRAVSFWGSLQDRSGPLGRARASWGQVKEAAPGYSARAARATPSSARQICPRVQFSASPDMRWPTLCKKPTDVNRRAIYFGLFLDRPTPAGGAARKVEVLTRHSRWNLARAPSILRCPQCWASGRCRRPPSARASNETTPLLPMRSAVLQARPERRSRKLHQSDRSKARASSLSRHPLAQT